MKKVLAVFMLVFLFTGLFGQMTGKISGIISSDDGEPLVGANVLVEGQSLGAAAGVDGGYVILDVPVGTYTVKFSYIGYKDFIVNDLRVNGGLTTGLDAALVVAAIEGESVVVSAVRPLIKKDATSTINILEAEALEAMPIRGLAGVVGTMPGVIVQDGNIHIRGGRDNEISFSVNGANTTSMVSRNSLVYVPQEAVEEIQVQVGGYDAETGGANSGVIKRQVKTGSSTLKGSFTYQTDGTAGDAAFGFADSYSYGQNFMVGTLSGPILSDKLQFFASVEKAEEEDPFTKVSNGFNFKDIPDDSPYNSSYADTVNLVWDDGITRGGQNERLNIIGSLSANLGALRGTFTYIKGDRKLYQGGDILSHLATMGATVKGTVSRDTLPGTNEYVIPGRNLYTQINSDLITAEGSFSISGNTLLKVGFNNLKYTTDEEDDWFGNNWEKWADSAAVQQHLGFSDTLYTPMTKAFTYKAGYELYGMPFARPGSRPNINYNKYEYTSTGFSAVLQSQMGNHNIKFGVEAKNYTIRNYGVSSSLALFSTDPAYGLANYSIETYGSMDAISDLKWSQYAAGYGYDLKGNAIEDRKFYYIPSSSGANEKDTLYIDGLKKPTEMGFFFQDKIEYNDIVINAGIRVDKLDGDDQTVDRVDSLKLYRGTSYIRADQWKKLEANVEIQPRLGISFPLNDRLVVYGYYGRFSQLNDLQQIYYSQSNYQAQMLGGNYYLNPIGFGLQPVRTTQYEIGLKRQISDNAAITVTGFYKNQKGLVQAERVNDVKGDLKAAYNYRVNGDFATHKGLELVFNMRRTNRLSANANYTFTQAEGTGSGALAYLSSVDRVSARPSVVSPLDYSQAHTGSISLDYRFGNKDGGLIFQNLGANLLFSFSSGHPFTFVYAPSGGQVDAYDAGVDYMQDTRSRQALEPIGSSTTPWSFTTDLKLDKSFYLAGVRLTAFTRIQNIFDRNNVLNVYQRTGSDTDDGFLSDPQYSTGFVDQYGDNYVELYKAVNLDNDEAYRTDAGVEIYSSPRQVWVGLSVAF